MFHKKKFRQKKFAKQKIGQTVNFWPKNFFPQFFFFAKQNISPTKILTTKNSFAGKKNFAIKKFAQKNLLQK